MAGTIAAARATVTLLQPWCYCDLHPAFMMRWREKCVAPQVALAKKLHIRIDKYFSVEIEAKCHQVVKVAINVVLRIRVD